MAYYDDGDDLMPVDRFVSGTQTVRYFFDNISDLTQSPRYSPNFYNCNTLWNINIEKNFDGNIPYLSVFLDKVDITDELEYSYEVTMEVTLFSKNAKYNVVSDLHEDSPNSRYVFGTREGESLSWGIRYLIPFNKIFNPKFGFLGDYEDGDEDCIEIQVIMGLERILPHHGDCTCNICM